MLRYFDKKYSLARGDCTFFGPRLMRISVSTESTVRSKLHEDWKLSFNFCGFSRKALELSQRNQPRPYGVWTFFTSAHIQSISISYWTESTRTILYFTLVSRSRWILSTKVMFSDILPCCCFNVLPYLMKAVKPHFQRRLVNTALWKWQSLIKAWPWR